MTAYRYPNEQFVLILTCALIGLILLFGAGVTLCVAPILLVVMLVISARLTQQAHHSLLQQGTPVTPQSAPQLSALVQRCARRLQPGAVDVVVVPARPLNAFTFGMSEPNMIVLHSSLLKVMDEGELAFIIGHEMGHVALGHTWLNSLLGGMAGVPMTIDAMLVLTLGFRWWNRSCEYSADRAGLLACGDVRKAVNALVKLVNREADTPQEVQQTLQIIEQEDDSLANVLAETLSSHPMLVKRIEELRRYATSGEYQRLQAYINTKHA